MTKEGQESRKGTLYLTHLLFFIYNTIRQFVIATFSPSFSPVDNRSFFGRSRKKVHYFPVSSRSRKELLTMPPLDLKPDFTEKEFRPILDPDLPRIPLLADETGQVILNILVNAAHSIDETLGKGTGQGLAIRHDVIVEKHGGTIAVESLVNVGTTFIIRLPLAKESS
jgi:signal transduction histidine kinase